MGPPIAGAGVSVNSGPGDQTDPHVSGDMCAYTNQLTGVSTIRYQSLGTGVDQQVPSAANAFDFLSDVSNGVVVFTRVLPGQSSIYTFDTTTALAPAEVAPLAGSARQGGSIGANTIAWQDFGFSATGTDSEIVAYDRPSGAQTRLTNDALLDQSASVSPDGTAVAWVKCQIDGSGCTVWSANGGGSAWATRGLTTNAAESHPDTNGSIVAYASNRSVGGVPTTGIYWQPVGGGTEQHLVMPGNQSNPSMAGNFIAFDDLAPGATTRDIFVYDLSTNTAYQLTSTPVDETLTDISVATDGLVRVVWQAQDATMDVFAFSFRLTSVCDPGAGGSADAGSSGSPDAGKCHGKGKGNGNGDDDCDEGGDGNGQGDDGEGDHHPVADAGSSSGTSCANPGSRPLLATLQMTRGHGKPAHAEVEFAALPTDDGLLCFENGIGDDDATAGSVSLNGREEVGPRDFRRDELSEQRSVSLVAQNELDGTIRGEPGGGYRVRVYGAANVCQQASAVVGTLRVQNAGTTNLQSVVGRTVSVEAVTANGPDASSPPPAGGCSTTGGGWMWMLALGTALWLWRARPLAPVRLRSRRQ